MISIGKMNILVAEDEKSYSRALVLKLQHAGYEAMSVENGKDALEILKNKNIDLLILDLIMPQMNGFLVLEEMKKQKIKTPTIVVSNLSQIDDEKKVLSLGAKDFLIKSNISISDLIAKIDTFFKK